MKNRRGIVWLAPGLLWVFVFTIIPLINLITTSFNETNLLQPTSDTFVGFDNYGELVSDSVFTSAVPVTIQYVIVSILLTMIVGLFTGWLFSYDLPGIRFLRRLFTIPLFIAPVAVGSMGLLLFNTNYGFFSGLAPLTSPNTALFAVIFMDSWRWTPLVFMVVILAIESIPQEAFDNARIDANSDWSIFRYVTMPRIASPLLIILLLRMLESLKVFDLIITMTAGGPGRSTTNIPYLAYTQIFRSFNIGEGAAMSIICLVPTMLVGGLIVFQTTKNTTTAKPKRKVGQR